MVQSGARQNALCVTMKYLRLIGLVVGTGTSETDEVTESVETLRISMLDAMTASEVVEFSTAVDASAGVTDTAVFFVFVEMKPEAREEKKTEIPRSKET